MYRAQRLLRCKFRFRLFYADVLMLRAQGICPSIPWRPRQRVRALTTLQLLPSQHAGWPFSSVHRRVFAAGLRANGCGGCAQLLGWQASRGGEMLLTLGAASELRLLTDLVVRTSMTLRIVNATFFLAAHQIRVEPGARLELEDVTVADSQGSSALVVQGEATGLRCTFVRCSASTNVVLSGIDTQHTQTI